MQISLVNYFLDGRLFHIWPFVAYDGYFMKKKHLVLSCENISGKKTDGNRKLMKRFLRWWNEYRHDSETKTIFNGYLCVFTSFSWLAHWFRFIKHRQTQVYLLSYRCIFSSFFINCYMHASIHWGYKSFYPFQTCVSIT